MVSLNQEEWAELSPEEKRLHRIQEEKNVFGSDVQHDKFGNPIETGIGSAWSIKNRPELNRNHFANILKNEGPDAHARALAQAGLKQAP